MLFFWIVGLENVFCTGDYENAISLHRGKKCIGVKFWHILVIFVYYKSCDYE